MLALLSYFFFPLAIANSILAFPFLKYIFVGTIVKPSLCILPINLSTSFLFNKRGGDGAISVSANIAPKLCSDFQKFSVNKDEKSQKQASDLDKILQPIHQAMFVESNPSPVKYAAKLLTLCDDAVRLPLVKITESSKEVVKKALKSSNLI